jgi:hypothetical protein
MEFRKQRIEYNKAQLAQHQDSILKGAEIFASSTPPTRPVILRRWQRRSRRASTFRKSRSSLTPNMPQGVIHIADALKPQSSDGLKIITPQPGGGAYGYDPRTQHATTIIQPNDNPALTGQPVGQGMPHVTDQSSYDAVPPGAQYMSPDGHIRTKQGGQTGAPSGGFL